MNDEPVYRTAPATPGLLNTHVGYLYALYFTYFNHKKDLNHLTHIYPIVQRPAPPISL